MKKLFVSMMLAGATLFTGVACAQTETQKSENTECCSTKEGKECKKDKKSDRKELGKKGYRSGNNPFNGIELSEDQQKRLMELQKGLGPVMPQSYEKNDTASKMSKEDKAKMRQQRDAQRNEAKKNYLYGVKEVLTPEQYVVFLENVYLYGGPQQQAPTKMAPRKKMSDGKTKGDGKMIKKDRPSGKKDKK